MRRVARINYRTVCARAKGENYRGETCIYEMNSDKLTILYVYGEIITGKNGGDDNGKRDGKRLVRTIAWSKKPFEPATASRWFVRPYCCFRADDERTTLLNVPAKQPITNLDKM